MKDTKKIFLTSLLSILFIFSNVVASKITLIAKLPVSSSVFIYALTFLCVLLIIHSYGYKEGVKSICIALFCQCICFCLSIIICNIPNGSPTIATSRALQTILAPEKTNNIYHPAFSLMFGSLLSFFFSQIINASLYEIFNKYTMNILAASLSMLISLILDAALFTLITNIGVINTMTIAEAIMNQFIIRVFISIILTILFLMFSLKNE